MKFIFGGTSEGRRMAEEALKIGEDVVVCVASAYGRALLPEGVTCYDHPMELPEMMETARRHGPDVLYDATHPFAVRVSQNIRACANALGIRYERTRRPAGEGDWRDAVFWARDAEDASMRLSGYEGNVLLTTGGNTVGIYARTVPPERLYVRVLATVDALAKCDAAGIVPSHILAMQGPFSEAFNRALYVQWDIQNVVTKDSGTAGGVDEKIRPALMMGLNVIVIERPKE